MDREDDDDRVYDVDSDEGCWVWMTNHFSEYYLWEYYFCHFTSSTEFRFLW